MDKRTARTLASSLLRILNQQKVDCFDLEAAISDVEKLAKGLEAAAEEAYTDNGDPKKGWAFE